MQIGRRELAIKILHRSQHVDWPEWPPGLVQSEEHIPLISHVASLDVLDSEIAQEGTIRRGARTDEYKTETDALAHVYKFNTIWFAPPAKLYIPVGIRP